MPLQIRRGPTADRLAVIPLVGELVYDTNTKAVFVGDGISVGGLPVTSFSVGDARETTGRLFLGTPESGIGVGSDNTVHSGITFAYNSTTGRLQATVAQDLSDYIGLIVADQGFKGNLWADDSGLIVNSETHTVYGNFVPQGHIIPETNIAYDLGSSSYRFRDLYLSGSSIYLGNAVITSTGTAINFPTGSTVGGQPLGINEGDAYNIVVTGNVIGVDSTVLVNTTNGTFHGDLTGSVFADDSTMLVDGRDGVLRGTLIGALTGNVTGNLTGVASTATLASNVSLIDSSSSVTTHYLTFSLGTSGTQVISADTSLTYQPSSNTLGIGILNSTTINATSVSATSLTGNIFTSLIDTADSSAITVTPAIVFNSDVTAENNFNVVGDILPVTSEQTNIGSFINKFNKLYLTEGANALWIGNAAISGSGTTVNLPAGSTVGGSAITTAAGSNATTITVNTTGTSADYFIAFFDDQTGDNLIFTDDTLKYNPGTGYLTVGNATIGTVYGNVQGNVTGNVLGNVTGVLAGNADTATVASTVTLLSTDAANVTHYITFTDAATGNENIRTDTSLTYNPFSNTLTAGTFSGTVTSSATGTFASLTTSNISNANSFGTTSIASTVYSSVSSLFSISQAHTTADARNVGFFRSRGTTTVPTTISNGDDIADLVFLGYGTSAYVGAASISIKVNDSGISNTSMKSEMIFSVNDPDGPSGFREAMTIETNGQLTVDYGLSTGSIQLIENNINGTNSNEDIVINPSGTGTVDFVVTAQSTVGSAGVANALPATPSTYFKIKVNGVEYVVPAYAVA
jgi:hypothetical protein